MNGSLLSSGPSQPQKAPDLVHQIQRAASQSGVSFDFLLATAMRESSLNPQAKAKSSSAAGLFQFVEQTWLATIKTHGSQFGLDHEASQITKLENGQYTVENPIDRQTILDMRFDPATSSALAAMLAEENRDGLSNRLGRPVTDGELYIAHFLGVGGAAKLLSADTRATAASLLPAAARANPAIFFADGIARSSAQVVDALQSGFLKDQHPLSEHLPPALSTTRQHAPMLPKALPSDLTTMVKTPAHAIAHAGHSHHGEPVAAHGPTQLPQQNQPRHIPTGHISPRLSVALTTLLLALDPVQVIRDRTQENRR